MVSQSRRNRFRRKRQIVLSLESLEIRVIPAVFIVVRDDRRRRRGKLARCHRSGQFKRRR